MYIEFQLPTGAGGWAAAHASGMIRKQIAEWAALNEIKYKTKVHKYTLRLCLESDAEYTFFQLSWTGRKDYAIVKTES